MAWMQIRWMVQQLELAHLQMVSLIASHSSYLTNAGTPEMLMVISRTPLIEAEIIEVRMYRSVSFWVWVSMSHLC